jgi:hypothetical protein
LEYTHRMQRAGVVRIVLGTAQVIAATISLVCWISTGESRLTMFATAGTLALVIASMAIFRGR